MNKRLRSNNRRSADRDAPKRSETSFWQAALIALVSTVLFFGLLEAGLALFGVQPALRDEDPFVGFASNVPLFIEDEKGLTTAPNKRDFFNPQRFLKSKPSGTYRIFCLGGSTTYGRPYNDETSFSGWLRELLPVADPSKRWEVINAGGISYASYRVAHLMEELVRYDPDLFIIYTGHNEFLEERTYRQIRDIPPVFRPAVTLMAKTRTWSAMSGALQRLGLTHRAVDQGRTLLASEVDAILERSAGLDRYSRDDSLSNSILRHYRISLERMVEKARSAGARVVFVTPASNLKDCSPFKSQHTPQIGPGAAQRSVAILAQAKEAIAGQDWQGALDLLDAAVVLDPRYAELHYRRGRILLEAGRYAEAANALRLARDEDICPLRALTPIAEIVAQVAAEQDAGLVDYIGLLRQRMLEEHGHGVPGGEYFLDHVHPTITGHKLLALALIGEMTAEDLVRPGMNWNVEAIAAVDARIRGSVDAEAHALALANLARVFYWAQKTAEAEHLALEALESVEVFANAAINATSTLSTIYMKQGHHQRALSQLYKALERVPDAIELRLQLGQFLLSSAIGEREKAAANLLLVSLVMPNYDQAHALFGMAMAMRGRPAVAYPSLMRALQINPNNRRARLVLEKLQPLLADQSAAAQPADIVLEQYPSGAPKRLFQIRRHANGRPVPDGIEVKFHENGRLMNFVDIDRGKAVGPEMTWDDDGKELSRQARQ